MGRKTRSARLLGTGLWGFANDPIVLGSRAILGDCEALGRQAALQKFSHRGGAARVTHADQRRLFGLANQQFHELVLALRIKRGRRLVQHDDIGVVKNDAGERQALLFAARQGLVPGTFLVDPIGQMAEPDTLERRCDFLMAAAFGGFRVGRGAAQ
jgi:hypothetical protein